MTMPHVNSGGSEDFFSNDEVKVYKDEGEEEKRSSENLSEDKLGLVTETEEGKNGGLGNGYDGDKTENGREDEIFLFVNTFLYAD
ncbi:transcription factor 7-like 2 [Mytilus galloprovincialis]|uniref:Transcription factor 7-like 2 n=1 Tax=Mytilus galloprovincialis TaxID=29158 RepID=A0A8B6BQJ1_MYTGA|nr:transcription factor 7-like 2 [Mytilus galloprovincialis]